MWGQQALKQRCRWVAILGPASLYTAERVLDAKFDSGRPFGSEATTLPATFVPSLSDSICRLSGVDISGCPGPALGTTKPAAGAKHRWRTGQQTTRAVGCAGGRDGWRDQPG